MNIKALVVATALAVAGFMSANTAEAVGRQTREIIWCSENTCLVRTCTTIGIDTQCSTGLEPRLPDWGPGYPSEP